MNNSKQPNKSGKSQKWPLYASLGGITLAMLLNSCIQEPDIIKDCDHHHDRKPDDPTVVDSIPNAGKTVVVTDKDIVENYYSEKYSSGFKPGFCSNIYNADTVKIQVSDFDTDGARLFFDFLLGEMNYHGVNFKKLEVSFLMNSATMQNQYPLDIFYALKRAQLLGRYYMSGRTEINGWTYDQINPVWPADIELIFTYNIKSAIIGTPGFTDWKTPEYLDKMQLLIACGIKLLNIDDYPELKEKLENTSNPYLNKGYTSANSIPPKGSSRVMPGMMNAYIRGLAGEGKGAYC